MNLNEAIAEVLAALPRHFIDRVITELEPGLAPACCDTATFQSALLALLSHTGNAIPPGEQLVLRTSAESPLPSEDRLMVELSAPAAGGGPASWPGLIEAEPYIRQCGASTQVSGSAVRLFLPRQSGTAVLVVEDQPDVRRFAAEVLAAQGYRVLEAGSGLEAMQLWRSAQGEVALLVADVMLPGMTGLELAERLQELQPSLKVLLVSGYNSVAAENRGSLSPGALYLPKPFTPEALAESARTALQRSTVLMLDDSQPVRRMQREVLEMGGYTVLEAGTLAEARESMAARHDIDLVLADAYLPDGSGVAFASELRKARPGVRVILISGAFDDDVPISPRLLRQVDDVLAKPVSPEVLLERVRAVLSRARGNPPAGA